MNLFKSVLYYFWLSYFYIKNSPTLLFLTIKREYLLFQIFIKELFGR